MRQIVFFFALFLAAPVMGAVVIQGEDFSGEDLRKFCDVLVDPSGEVNIAAVLGSSELSGWTQCRDQSLSRGYSGETLWLKFAFANKRTESQIFYIHLPAPWLSDIRVYTQADAGAVEVKRYGSGLPFKQRGILSGGFFIPISVAPNREQVAYLSVSSLGAVTVGGQVFSEQGMTSRYLFNTLSIGFLIGGISLLMVYSLAVYVLLRDINYLNYSLYSLAVLAFCGTMYGYNYQFFWPEYAEFNFRANSASAGVIALSLLGFARRFLTLPILSPLADRVLIFLAALMAVGFVLSFTGIEYSAIITYNSAVGTFVLGYVVFIGFLAWRRRAAGAGYFLVAWSISMSGLALVASMAQGILEYSDFYLYALGIGMLLEMSLLSVAIAGRIRVLSVQKDRAQVMLANNLARSQRVLEIKVKERTYELEAAKKDAEHLARTDSLTGLNNRRAFYDYGELMWHQQQRNNIQCSVCMIDIDFFKKINDTHGHSVGDLALKAVSQAILLNLRDADIVGRIGGEEFALILPHTNVAAAALLAERLRAAIANISLSNDGVTINLTTSIGIAECGSEDKSFEETLNRADRALYIAKQEGRDRVAALDS